MSAIDKLSVQYAFTITIKPSLFKSEPELQYDVTSEYVLHKLKKKTCAITLVAELTRNANIHYHGVIQFPLGKRFINYNKVFHKIFRGDKIIGFVNFRQIDNDTKWYEYIKKDIRLTYDSISRRPIIYDFFDVFTEEERSLYGVTW